MHTNFKTSNEIELRRRMMWWKVFFFVILTKLNFPKSSYEEEEYENQLKDFLLRNKLNLVLVTDPWYPHVCIVWVMFLESVLVAVETTFRVTRSRLWASSHVKPLSGSQDLGSVSLSLEKTHRFPFLWLSLLFQNDLNDFDSI